MVEADESDGTFIEIAPEAVILTNVEADHLDHYGDMAALEAACARYLSGAPGPRVACADDPGVGPPGRRGDRRRPARPHLRRGGRAPTTASRATGHGGGRRPARQPLHACCATASPSARSSCPLPAATTPATPPGRRRWRRRSACPSTPSAAALGRFAGVARRFQFHGEIAGVTLVDDYAHLPGEIKATLAAAREGAWSRIVAVFQPHRYTRTARLWRDFGDAFADADVVVLTDVYAAGEPPQPGVSGRLILQAVCEARPSGRVLYLPKRADILARLPDLTRPGDLVITLGAGDVTSLPDEWLKAAARERAPKQTTGRQALSARAWRLLRCEKTSTMSLPG